MDGADDATSFGEQSASHGGGLWLALAGSALPDAAATALAEGVAPSEATETAQSAEVAETTETDASAELAVSEVTADAASDAALAGGDEVAAAAEEAPAAASESAANQVHGVQLDSVDGHDRVVIVTEAPARYDLSEVDGKTRGVRIELALYQYGNNTLSAHSGHIQKVLPFTSDLDTVAEKLGGAAVSGRDPSARAC